MRGILFKTLRSAIASALEDNPLRESERAEADTHAGVQARTHVSRLRGASRTHVSRSRLQAACLHRDRSAHARGVCVRAWRRRAVTCRVVLHILRVLP
jgi:hypothetical protein